MTGIEPVTSSLPRKHSTPELHRQGFVSTLILNADKWKLSTFKGLESRLSCENQKLSADTGSLFFKDFYG